MTPHPLSQLLAATTFTAALCTSLLLCTAPAFAQEPDADADTEPTAFQAGPALLAHLSNVDFQELDDPFSLRLGAGAGLQLSYAFHPRFALQPELLYVQRGMTGTTIDIDSLPDPNDEDAEAPTGQEQTFNFHYLQLPLIAAYQLPLPADFALRAGAGPSVSLFLNRTRSTTQETVPTASTGLTTLTFGATATLALERPIARGTFSLGLRYDRDLTSFVDTTTPDADPVVHWAASLAIAYRLHLF